MIIHLKKSTLFTVDPDLRFVRANKVPLGLWSNMYFKRTEQNFSVNDLCEYFEFKTGQKMSNWYMTRWLWRARIYWRVQVAINDGAEMVVSSFFGDDEMSVIKEITKNLRSSVNKTTKTLP